MKRQRISPQSLEADSNGSSAASLQAMDASTASHRWTATARPTGDDPDDLEGLAMRPPSVQQRLRNVLEAQVQEGDTLQAIAIRYSCSVAEIRRLNKIERDYEIHAHKTLQVPLTADNILADHLSDGVDGVPPGQSATVRQTLLAIEAQTAANGDGQVKSGSTQQPSINDIILNTKIVPNAYADATANDAQSSFDRDDEAEASEQFLLIDDDENVPQPRSIHAGRKLMVQDLSCSGSDCDMSWVCLLVCILALCFAIPLVYVFYIAEHHHDHDEAATAASLPKLHEMHPSSV